MSGANPTFTSLRKCEHCENRAPMLVAATYSQVESHEEDVDSPFATYWEEGYVYELLECPACRGIVMRRYYYHDQLAQEGDGLQVIYPVTQGMVDGLPSIVERSYEAARRVKNIDPNAFGVLLGRVLDTVCKDREAKGESLFERVKHLAAKGDIPANLVDVAHSLRQMRNVGAHGDLGELTAKEIPLLEDLTRAILEYVYRAPLLAARAAERMKHIRPRQDEAAGKDD